MSFQILSTDTVETILSDLSFNERGLLPAIAQQYDTKEVLMLAWVSKESLIETFTKGHVCYFSRSRGKLWRKGESSGQTQHLLEAFIDCDGDTILFIVDQKGVACHTGRKSCFYRKVTPEGLKIVTEPLLSQEELYGTPSSKET